MKDVVPLAILILIGVFAVHYLNKPEVVTKTIVKKGDPVIVVEYDTIEVEKTVYKTNIEYRTKIDTVRDTIKVSYASTYKDSTEDYLLEVTAYAPTKVDSFHSNIEIFKADTIINQTDTVFTTETVKETDYTYTTIALLLGLAL